MASNKRITWIDYARTFAIVCVILCHSTEYIYQFDLDAVLSRSLVSQIISFLYLALGRFGVPFFLFMTGFLMLDRRYDKQATRSFYKSKWLKLLLVTEIWILIYIAYRVVIDHHVLDLVWVIKNMLLLTPSSLMPHVWYMPMILAIYLILPLLANGLQILKDHKVLLFSMAALILIFFAVPVVNTFNAALGNEPVMSLVSTRLKIVAYGCYLMLGYFCKRGLFDSANSVVLVVICVVGTSMVVGEQLFAYHHGVVYNLWYNDLFLLLAALSLFVLISRIPFRTDRGVGLLAKFSFAIYLIHFLVLYGVAYLGDMMPIVLPSFVAVIVMTFIVCVLSLAACMLIAKMPRFGKSVLYLR